MQKSAPGQALRRGSSSSAMLSGLLSRRVLFLLGKGGAGTTTISAALAAAAARGGRNVLAMECDGRAPMAAALDAKSGYEPVRASEGLFVMALDGRRAVEEYLRLVIPARAVLRAVFASHLYQFFVQAAPGLKELMALGKVCYEAGRRDAGSSPWDLIVVDGPASGQALSIIRMPAAARETFGQSIVGREAGNIGRMLRDPREFAVLLVTTPEPLAVAETIETCDALRAAGVAPAAFILNRAAVPRFSARDAARLRAHLSSSGNPRAGEHLARIAKRELDRSAQANHALAELRRHAQAPPHAQMPVFRFPEIPGRSGLALIDGLAREIARQMGGARP